MGSDCDVRAEWSGAMRRGHRIWIHPLARCGLAAAIAIARSNTGFGECRRRKTGERQGSAYRADHRLPSRVRGPVANFSGTSKFLRGSRNAQSGTAYRATASSERRRRPASELPQTMARSIWKWLARDPSTYLQVFPEESAIGRHRAVPRLPTAWPPDTSSTPRWPRSGRFSGRMPFQLPPRSTTC